MAEEKLENKGKETKEEKIDAKPKEETPENKKESKKKEVKEEIPTKEKKEESKESKIILQREYVIPLRREILKVPRYKRAKKAVKAIKQFLAKHMKVEDRDINKVKIDRYLNEQMWSRGIKNPMTKIKVIAKKLEDGIVKVELSEISDKIKWRMERQKKVHAPAQETKEKIKEQKTGKKPEETPEEKKEEQEKEKATVEAGLKSQKLEAKQEKHTEKPIKPKAQQIHRKALNRH